MNVSSRLNIGTTAVRLIDLLRTGSGPGSATSSETYPQLLSDCARFYLAVESGSPGSIFLKSSSDLSTTDFDKELVQGDDLLDAAQNNANLADLSSWWLLGGAASSKVGIRIVYA